MLEQLQIYAIKITKDIPQVIFGQLCKGLTRERQKQIKNFRHYKDGQRSMLAELLLKQLIYQYRGLQNDEVILKTNEYGKPFLVGVGDFHFNISHAGEWVVCAVDCMPVGIDVEQIQSIDMDIEEFARENFSPVEHQILLDTPIAKREERFIELWTLKESYIKAVGKGLSIDLDSFSVEIREEGKIVFQTKEQRGKWYFRQYEIDRDYKLALCRGGDEFPGDVHILDSDIFISKLGEGNSHISEMML